MSTNFSSLIVMGNKIFDFIIKFYETNEVLQRECWHDLSRKVYNFKISFFTKTKLQLSTQNGNQFGHDVGKRVTIILCSASFFFILVSCCQYFFMNLKEEAMMCYFNLVVVDQKVVGRFETNFHNLPTIYYLLHI